MLFTNHKIRQDSETPRALTTSMIAFVGVSDGRADAATLDIDQQSACFGRALTYFSPTRDCCRPCFVSTDALPDNRHVLPCCAAVSLPTGLLIS